jgi:hypothetical protein
MDKLRTHWLEMMATSVTVLLIGFAYVVLAGFTHG